MVSSLKMRLKLSKIFTILVLIAGSGDARPQQIEVASLQPEVEAENTEGWQPVQHDGNISQDSIPVGKDLPQIVEGNSRYTEEGRARRRKSYVINNLFYGDYIPVNHKTSDKSYEQLDTEAFRSKASNEYIRKSKKDEKGKSNKIQKAGNIISFLGNERFSGTNKSRNPAIVQRKSIRSHYITKIGSKPLSLKNLTNVNPILKLDVNTSSSEQRTLGNKSQTIGNFANVRPQIISHSRAISGGHKPREVKEEKAMNFIKIVSPYDGSKNSTISQSDLYNIRNQVFRPDPFNLRNDEVKHSRSNSSDLLNAFQRVAIETNKNRFGTKNRTKNIVRIKPQANSEYHETTKQEHGKNTNKNIVRLVKPKSNQSNSDAYFKNWPNGNLQNIEDLFNYEKYTSFHNENDNFEVPDTINHSVSHDNLGNVHTVTQEPIKTPGSGSSIFIFDHSLPPNGDADVTNSHDPVSHVSHDQSGQEVVQWEQINPVVSDDSDFLVTGINEAEDTFSSIPEGLDPNRPLNAEHDDTQSTNYHEHVDESLTGDNPALQITQNYDDHLDQVQEFQPNFPNPYSEVDLTRPVDETYNDYQNGVIYKPVSSSKQPYFNPTSVVSQNTVVHILNNGKKRPNVTVTEMQVVPDNSSSLSNPKDPVVDKKNSSVSTPNVHIMFTTQEDEVEELSDSQNGVVLNQQKPEVTYDDSLNCPTIMINSYTRINNTVQSKEGCTDLNIIINSHVLNTNVFNPADKTSTGNLRPDNKIPSERYPGNGQADPSYDIPESGYGTFPIQDGQNAGGSLPGDFQDIPVTDGQNSQAIFQSPSTSVFEVFQQTQINVGSQNDVPSAGDALDTGVANDPLNAEPEVAESGSPIPDAFPETALSDPVSLTEIADDPGPAGIADVQAPLADSSGGVAAADSPVSQGTGGLQLPGGNNPLSGIPGQLSDAVGNLGSQNGGSGTNTGSGSPGSILGGGGDDDDEDDEDMMELMPFSIIESMSSMLPYFTLLNPLNYGFLSLAISPFAVAAAGLFGIVAAFVPFAFPNAFNFGRATNEVTVKVKPSFENMVKESINQYENWNEWKRKRKKRRK